jgi:hypothetical protein
MPPWQRWTLKALQKRVEEKFKRHRTEWREWEGQKYNLDKEKKQLKTQKKYQEHGIKNLKSEYLLCHVPDEFREQPRMNSQPEFPPFDPSGGVFLPDTPSGMDLASHVDIGLQPGSPYVQNNVYTGGTFHQNPSQLDLVADPTITSQYGGSSIPYYASSNFDLSSNHRAALQPAPSSISFLHPPPDAGPAFAAQEQHELSSISPLPCTSTTFGDFFQEKKEEPRDSAHESTPPSSNSEAVRQEALERQKHSSPPLDETSTNPPLNDESAAASDRKELSRPRLGDDVEIAEADPRPLSGNGMRRSTSCGGIEKFPGVKGFQQDLQPSEPNLVSEVTNDNVPEDVDEPKKTETPIIERRTVVSQAPSQAELPTATSTKESSTRFQSAIPNPSRYKQQQFGQALGLHSLPKNLQQQLEHNHMQNVLFLRQEREARAFRNLKSRRSLGAFSQPEQGMGFFCDVTGQQFGHHRQSMQDLSAHHASRNSSALTSQKIEQGRPASPFPFHQDVCHATSTKAFCSTRKTPVGGGVPIDAQSTQSSVPRMRDVLFKRESQTPVNARSIPSASRVAVSDNAPNTNYHSRTASASSGYHIAQSPHSISPSIHHLRAPGGPISPRTISIAGSVAVGGHTPVLEPYSRPFSAFSGNHLPQRPHPMHPTTSELRSPVKYMSDAEYLRSVSSPHSPLNTPDSFPYALTPWVQSSPNLSISGSYRSTYASSNYPSQNLSADPPMQLNHRRSMCYLPPGGSLVSNPEIMSPPKRGTTRSPRQIPMLPCSPANMTVSYDKNGESIGFHYAPQPERWSGAIHAIEERKRDMVGGLKWKSLQPARIAEEGEEGGRGLYGFLETNEGMTNGRGKVRMV